MNRTFFDWGKAWSYYLTMRTRYDTKIDADDLMSNHCIYKFIITLYWMGITYEK